MMVFFENKDWKRGLLVTAGALLLAMGLVLPVQSQSANPDYAILIVGDEGTAEMLREEKVLISEMAKLIRTQPPDQRLPIYSYHFNKERERAYCENKLNVLSEDLLFVGIVKLKDKVPLKVVYRVDRINNSARAAKDILARAQEITSESSPTATATPSATPDVVETPQPPVEEGDGFRVQLGSFAQLKYAEDKVAEATRSELEVAIVESKGPDGDTLYKVLSPILTDRTEADELLEKFHEAGFEEAFLTRTEE
jgi:sporulation related protein